MSRAFATLGGILILALCAGVLAEATLAVGGRGTIANDTLLRPSSPAPSPSPAKAKAAPSPTPNPTPVLTPSPTPLAGPTATTNAFVHLREGDSTDTPILENLNGGTEVSLLPYSNSTWQEVEYQGITGYIYRSYLEY